MINIDCDLTHLVRTLRAAGHRPRPPEPYGAGVGVRLLGDHRQVIGSVLVTQAPFGGREWIHASIAWNTRTPTYEDLATLKTAVFGDRREAYQVFPPRSRHVNIHPHALHLWGRADGTRVLPDFDAWGTI